MVCFSNFLEATSTNFTWYILEYCLNYYKKQSQNNNSQEIHLGACDFAKK